MDSGMVMVGWFDAGLHGAGSDQAGAMADLAKVIHTVWHTLEKRAEAQLGQLSMADTHVWNMLMSRIKISADWIEIPLPDGSGSYWIPSKEKWIADQKAALKPEPMRTLAWLKQRESELTVLQREQAQDAEKAMHAKDSDLRARAERLMHMSRENWETARAFQIVIDVIEKEEAER